MKTAMFRQYGDDNYDRHNDINQRENMRMTTLLFNRWHNEVVGAKDIDRQAESGEVIDHDRSDDCDADKNVYEDTCEEHPGADDEEGHG